MTILPTLIVAAVVILIARVSVRLYQLSRREECNCTERESPCDSCLRWAECNGVDEQCPHIEVSQNEHD